MRRIAIIETSAFGGLLHYAAQLGDGLAGRGHEVDLIVPRHNELCGKPSRARMLDLLAAPSKPSDIRPRSPVRRTLKRARVALRLLMAWVRIFAEVRSGGYDVVIVNSSLYDPVGASGAIALNLLRRGALTIAIIHNPKPLVQGAQEGTSDRRPLGTQLTRAAISSFDMILVHGERSKAELERTWPHRAVGSIPHGDERVFTEEPLPPSPEQRVLLFGEWNWAKGIPVLMEAFDELCERLPDARITLAGTPDPGQVDLPSIHAWARRHGPRVELIEGYVPIEDVRGVFARARVVAVPYLAGYQSGVVHLAMTMGRAVVASDVGDISTAVVDGVTGVIVPPGDPQALGLALERMLLDPAFAERLGEAGRRAMGAGSSWEQVAESIERILDSLPAEPSAGGTP